MIPEQIKEDLMKLHKVAEAMSITFQQFHAVTCIDVCIGNILATTDQEVTDDYMYLLKCLKEYDKNWMVQYLVSELFMIVEKYEAYTEMHAF